MQPALSDQEAGRQILSIFVRYRVQAGGTLRRTHFFDVRDGDFQRGLNNAIANRWMTVHHRDRYRYILTEEGYAAGRHSEEAAQELTQASTQESAQEKIQENIQESSKASAQDSIKEMSASEA